MRKTYLGVCLVMVALLALGAMNALAQGAPGVTPTGVTKIITVTSTGVSPASLEINPGDTLIWAVVDQPATIYFSEGTRVRLAAVAPTHFWMNEEGAYTSGIIPPGGTASLTFVKPGPYNYAVFIREDVGSFR